MSWICTKCNLRIDVLLPVEDTDDVCPTCKSALNLVPDEGQEIKQRGPRKPLNPPKPPFDVELWRKKRDIRKKAEWEAFNAYVVNGDLQAYANRLKQIKDEQRNATGTDPSKIQ